MALALLAPSTAFAQDTGATEGDPVADEDANIIIVEGFQAALESAVGEKRNSDQIVESVTAEDIGKLPDNSIGESIARLPGITSQRTNGRANVIAIRGFGPDFSQTLLNGREQTTTGDSRAVEFDQYPSEVVNQVVVYKSPTASLVGQGLVGTVDIRTIRPLDYGESVLAIGARGSYADLGALNAGSNDLGYRVNATYVDQFADDTIGVSLAASYVDEPYQLQEFNAWGYFSPDGSGNVVPSGSKSFVTSTQLQRLGVMGTLQFEASPNLMLTLDGFYSNFEDDQSKRGIELPFSFFGTTFAGGGNVEDGQYTTGTYDNVQGVVRNDIFQKKADLYSAGFNAKYEGDNGFSGFVDFGYSRTDRNELSFESYAGTGYNWDNPDNIGDEYAADDVTDTIDFVSGPTGAIFSPSLDYSDPGLIQLTDPLGWGGSRVQAGYYNNRIIDDELFQYRAEGSYEFTDSFFRSFTLGVNFTDRNKSLLPDEFFIVLPDGAQIAPIPGEYLLEPTDLTYLGLGPIVSYDARELIEGGVLELERNTAQDVGAKAYSIDENLLTLYSQLNIEREYDNAVLTGNLGVQAIRTDQSSSANAFFNGTPVAVEAGATYWDILPSFNLTARFNSDWVVRMAASRQIMRPRLDDLRASIGYGINNNPSDSPTGQAPFISGGGGNPVLRPYRANAIDMNFEKYFGGSRGVASLQLFFKDIEEYILNGQFAFDYAGFPLPDGVTVPTTIGRLDAPINTGGGQLYGAELALTLPFGILTPSLEGLGFTGGASVTESNVKDQNGNETAIPGYSKWVVNGTLFYEQGGFNARASARYRSSFLGDFTGFGGSPTRRTALDETIIDAQIGYDFQDNSPLDGLSIYFQGQNLTDERFASVANEDSPLQVIDYQIYGRRFLAGFTYKFQ
ncbi:TonB-dependent receptor [Alteriqipengyuania flavescens]|nr:TonB-dependent receptor [Alteriqipengyuania flavescens]WJY25919.1 TonB-dependent receptor [Alteriqipengyuania flavescens]